MYVAGICQAGGVSAEAPYSPAGTSQNFYTAGLCQAGGIPVTPYSTGYRVITRLRGYHWERYGVRGFLTLPWNQKYRVLAYTYHPNWEQWYSARAVVTLPHKVGYKVVLKLQETYRRCYPIIATLSLPYLQGYRVRAFVRAYHAAKYKVKAIASQINRKQYKIKAKISIPYASGYFVKAITALPHCIGYQIRSFIVEPHNAGYKVRSVIRKMHQQGYKVHADLAATVGHWMYKVRARVNIAALVATLPKRAQEYITNKNWFNRG